MSIVMSGSLSSEEVEEDEEETMQPSPPALTEETRELLQIFTSLRGGPDIIRYFNALPCDERKALLTTMQTEMGMNVVESHHPRRGKPLFVRIVEIEKSMPPGLKIDLLKRYFNPGSSPEKNTQWIETVLRIPFDRFAPRITEEVLGTSLRVLDEAIYGHQDAKHKLVSYMAQLVRNQDSTGLILGLKSYPGVGKTNLVDSGVSKILGRPFYSTSLGGVHDSSFLRGFQYTYEGSEIGYMARCLTHAGIMNPVFFFDELDKISQTPHGDEIVNTLIQITDPIQSRFFQDRYLGTIATLDLSRCVFVFAYNDRSLINSILRDRITEIELHGFTPQDKLIIAKDYMVPRIVKDIGFPPNQIPKLADEAITTIIDRYTNEAGVRHLKRVLYEVFMELNLRAIVGKVSTPSVSQLSPITGEQVWSHIHRVRMSSPPSSSPTRFLLPAVVKTEHLEELIKTYKPITIERTSPQRILGRVNGLFVDSNGCSGILPLEAAWVPSVRRASYEMRYTGNLGKVMGESTRVAWSVAWNLLTPQKQEEWLLRWHPRPPPLQNSSRHHKPPEDTGGGGGLAGRASCHSACTTSSRQDEGTISRSLPIGSPPVFDIGGGSTPKIYSPPPTTITGDQGVNANARGCLHVHCRDNAMPKDGPSAGVALTILMWSMLTDTPLPQEVAYTGEIGLHGNLLPIGGLQEKLVGARRAGCRIVVIPQDNVDHLPPVTTLDKTMQVFPLSTIQEVIYLIQSV